MKIFQMKIQEVLFLLAVLSLIGCKKNNHFNSEAGIINSFSVKNENNTVFKAKINEDHSITIKVSPYVDAVTELKSAVPIFYLSKGATVYPDPEIPQDFSQEGGVKYTVTAEDGRTKQDYVVSWGISDLLPDGEGFSYAEIGKSKNFVELGYPGEYNNFDLADSKLYGDLLMYPAYCGDHIVLFSKIYADENPNSPYAIKVFNKETLTEDGTLNLGSISVSDLKLLSSDYKGNMVGMVIKNSETEFYYWTDIRSVPQSIGKVAVNMASTIDGSANFQVAGDITQTAWITSMAPRNANGEHYRIQVNNGVLASNYSVVTTGHSSNDCTGFQMISPLNDGDQPSFVVGDTEGTAGTANSIKAYLNSFAGTAQYTMPGLWQNTLQEWWVGTGFSTARIGGRAPFVSALVINGKSYAIVTSGTAWWHAAAVLTGDLQNLAHENLNIVSDINRNWSYGSYADWYYDEESKEAYLAVWFGRIGLKTYKLTCYE